MKKIFSLLCAMALVLSASAAPVKKVAVENNQLRSLRQLNVTKSDKMEKHHVDAAKLVDFAKARPAMVAKRAAASVADFAGAITVSNITATSASVSVAPTSTDAYYFDLLDAATYDDIVAGTNPNFTSISDYVEQYLAYMVNYYSMLGATVEDFLSNGADSYDFDELDPNTEYVIFAVNVDASGVASGVVVSERFTTSAVAPVDDFVGTITVSNISATGASVAVAPTSTGTYYWEIVDKEDYDAAVAGQLAAYGIADAAGLIEYYVAQYVSQGYPLSQILLTGNDSYSYSNLDPETEYAVVAVAMDEAGQASGPVTVEFFTTLAVEPSDLVLNITWDGTNLNINASNNDQYFVWIETKEDYDAYESDFTEASLLDEIEAWIYTLDENGYTRYALHTGSLTWEPNADFWAEWHEQAMENGVEYIILAAPYAGSVNGAPAYCVFTYGAPTALKNVDAAVKASKVIKNGQLVIEKNGVLFNAQGAKL